MIVAVTGSRGVLGRQVVNLLGESALVLEGDVRLAGTFAKRFDWLVHLAGALPHHFQQDPAHALEVNLEGTRRGLDACKINGAGLVLASSSAIYPADRQTNLVEDTPPAPVSAYGVSKRLSEDLAQFYYKQCSVPVRVLRFFNIYGPGQGAELLPGYLIRQALSGEAIFLRTPNAKRDFLHAIDAARAVVAALTTPDGGYQVYNIGNGMGHRVGEWTTLLEKLLGRSLPVTCDPAGEEIADEVVAQIDRAKQYLRWQPKIDLEQGIAMILEKGNVV